MAGKTHGNMALHVIRNFEVMFGKIPKVIEENLKFLDYLEATDQFICIACNVRIQRVVRDKKLTTANFKSHLVSEEHKKNTFSIDQIREALQDMFSGKIPQVIINNIFVLGMDESSFNCMICEKIIPHSSYMAVMEENFSYHLMSWGHLENLEKYRASLHLLQEVYGGIPSVIASNAEYLSDKGKHYFCSLCKVLLQIDPDDLSKTQESFENHLLTKEHLKNVKQAKAFSRLPGLKKLFTVLPKHILKNVEHFSAVGDNFYCSLCNQIVKCNSGDPFETEQNFKLHIFSDEHEQTLLCRRDENNQVFIRLKDMFDVFPESVMVNLKYLTLFEDVLHCNACEEFIRPGKNVNETVENITNHFDSDMHDNNLSVLSEQKASMMYTLEAVFGSLPDSVRANIEHIKVVEDNFECILCNKAIKCKGSAATAAKNFEDHFSSSQHKQEDDNLKALSQSLENDLEFLFGSVPQFIIENWNLIGYDDYNYNFYCHLCDCVIKVVYGSKKRPLTLQNFRKHLFSASHLSQIKEKANEEFKVTEKLSSIFGSVPPIILNHAEHLRLKSKNHVVCDLCGVNVDLNVLDVETVWLKFDHHLRSSRHKHKVQDFEECKVSAKKRLDNELKIWNIPGFLLKNIDHLRLSGKDLFCILCQEILPLDSGDITGTKKSLRLHFNSEEHKKNVDLVSNNN